MQLADFKITQEALATKCQTPSVVYNIDIKPSEIVIKIVLPSPLDLSKEEAKLLEINCHNAIELALSSFLKK